MKKVEIFVKFYAWYGVLAILCAYMMVSLQIIEPTHLAYKILNITGAVGITAEAYMKRDYQPVVLNAIFALIALAALLGVSFA